jgi:hypothetical protein
MTTSKRRLDKVEDSLSPTEAVLRWMGAAHQYRTISAYMDALKDAPDTRYPMMWLPERAAQTVRSARKGERPEVITRAERRAVREVAFLFYLQLQVNTWLWADWRAMCLQLAYVACKLTGLFQEDEPSESDLREARANAEQVISEFLQWAIAIRKIGDRYYAGTSPLFPGYAEQLAESIATAEKVATLFNDHLDWLSWLATERTTGTKGKRSKQRKLSPLPVQPIDFAELREAITPAGIALARHMVVMAQAEAAEFLGETRQALALVRAHLWPDTDRG